MKILITGGAGYLGSVIAGKMLNEGYEIIVLDKLLFNQTSLLQYTSNSNFKFIYGDVRNETLLEKLCNEADVIIPLAAIVGFPACAADPKLAKEINFDQIVNIVKFTNGIEIIMTPHIWQSDKIPNLGISQIPLILAWAVTIHKSQGATLEAAEIDVGSGIFECGQTYVALSRVKSLDGLYLSSFDAKRIRINKKVKDYYENLTQYHKTKETKSDEKYCKNLHDSKHNCENHVALLKIGGES